MKAFSEIASEFQSPSEVLVQAGQIFQALDTQSELNTFLTSLVQARGAVDIHRERAKRTPPLLPALSSDFDSDRWMKTDATPSGLSFGGLMPFFFLFFLSSLSLTLIL